MGDFEMSIRHTGATTDIECRGDLCEGALERVKEAVEISLRRGSTSLRVHADSLGVRAGTVPHETIWPDAQKRPAAADLNGAYYLG
jgi:hypothetical protein